MAPRSKRGNDTACLLLIDAEATEIQEEIDDLFAKLLSVFTEGNDNEAKHLMEELKVLWNFDDDNNHKILELIHPEYPARNDREREKRQTERSRTRLPCQYKTYEELAKQKSQSTSTSLVSQSRNQTETFDRPSEAST